MPRKTGHQLLEELEQRVGKIVEQARDREAAVIGRLVELEDEKSALKRLADRVKKLAA